MNEHKVLTEFNAEVLDNLRHFINHSRFSTNGGVITDLDGTALHEHEGRIFISTPVEYGLREIYKMGRPVVLNTLRFPLSVMRTFGKEWLAISGAPIPVVLMNGSQIGYVSRDERDELCFEELDAFPLNIGEIEEALKGVQSLLDGNIRDILLFYYPRDWRMGEIIWTPVSEKVLPVKEKYKSASSVTAVELPKLREQLLQEEICLIFLLIEVPADRLMAYQHSKPSNFITHKGVDKLTGSRAIAAKLGFDLADSIGAGDTPMDVFLNGVGLGIHVGSFELEFKGLKQTIKLKDPPALGDLLFRVAELQRELTV